MKISSIKKKLNKLKGEKDDVEEKCPNRETVKIHAANS